MIKVTKTLSAREDGELFTGKEISRRSRRVTLQGRLFMVTKITFERCVKLEVECPVEVDEKTIKVLATMVT
jgi:hypothetical protein